MGQAEWLFCFEEDIKAHNRYLMERNIRGAVRFIGDRIQPDQTFSQARVMLELAGPIGKFWSLDIEPQ